MSEISIEQVDAALRKARETDAPEQEIALMWIARAHLVGIDGVRPEYLQYAMGVSPERASELIAILSEHGLIALDGEG